MDEDILNNNGMEEEYIRKSFVVPNAAIKVACFKAGMTEEEEEDINRWKEDGAKVMSFEDCVTLVLEGLPIKNKEK